MIEETSLEAFEEVRQNLGERQKLVYNRLKSMRLATNTMIAKSLNIPINCVTPRIYELRQMKLVGVSKVDKCILTGRNAIYWHCVR